MQKWLPLQRADPPSWIDSDFLMSQIRLRPDPLRVLGIFGDLGIFQDYLFESNHIQIKTVLHFEYERVGQGVTSLRKSWM